jgi:hypothetical protein
LWGGGAERSRGKDNESERKKRENLRGEPEKINKLTNNKTERKEKIQVKL